MTGKIKADDPMFALSGTRAVDRRGVRYGRLTAVEPLSGRHGGAVVWRCMCDCGNEIDVRGTYLTNGSVRSCGCLRREELSDRAADRRGIRYGKLTAIEPVEERRGGGVVWRCVCDCGNEVTVRGNNLTTGSVKSCGRCREKETERVMRMVRYSVRHGRSTQDIMNRLRSCENV